MSNRTMAKVPTNRTPTHKMVVPSSFSGSNLKYTMVTITPLTIVVATTSNNLLRCINRV